MQGYQMYRYSFLTEYTEGSKKYINCYGYKYLSILTSGAINPLNNTPDQHNGEENFYLTELGKEKLLINHEIFNQPLPQDIKRLQLVHRTPLSDARDLEYGFGHYFVVLSDYKVNIPIPKENPYISFVESVVKETEIYKWLGKTKISSDYELKIPYLPAKYRDLSYAIESTATSFYITLKAYYTDIANEEAIDIFNRIATNTYTTNILVPFTRYRLLLHNRDSDTNKNFNIQFFWY